MQTRRKLSVARDRFATEGTFTISRGSRTEVNVVTVSLQAGDHVGRGECVPYARYGESMDSVCEQILGLAAGLAAGMDRDALQLAIAPGAARNAVDCALWDLEAKSRGMPVWQLAGLSEPLPVCADEACHDRHSLAALVGKYDVINIKLDKTGGLTEALAMRDAARAHGFGIMVGCMVGSSLAMAPAHLVAQGVEFADLDGPLLLAEDRQTPIRYEGSQMHGPSAALWG